MEERFETFTVLISKIARNIRKIKNMEMREYDLKGVEGACIFYLYENEILTATELSDKCEEDKATISRAVDRLQSLGFVDYQEKDGTHYKAPLILTEEGKAIGKRIFDKVDAVLDSAGIGLTDADRAEFYKSLAKISDNLDRIANKC